jgi:3'(2'), 5'-bisphosphate nucleotidase
MLRVIDLGGAGAGGRSGRVWVMDPIDGTQEFVRGGQYAIALALVEDGDQKVGVLGCPNLRLDAAEGQSAARIDEMRAGGLSQSEGGAWAMLSAVRGQGATMQTRSRSGVVSERRIERRGGPPDRLCLVDFEYSSSAAVDKHRLVASRLDADWPGPRLSALQMRYVALAIGAADVFLRLPKRKDHMEPVWDHAGGVLICEEAGGKVTDLDGKALDFGVGRWLTGNTGLVAVCGGRHYRVLETAKEIFDGNI